MHCLYFFITCCTLTIIKGIHSYVLLAASLRDFRTIAEKFITSHQIDEIIQDPGYTYNLQSNTNEQTDTDYSDNIRHNREDTAEMYSKSARKYQERIIKRVPYIQRKSTPVKAQNSKSIELTTGAKKYDAIEEPYINPVPYVQDTNPTINGQNPKAVHLTINDKRHDSINDQEYKAVPFKPVITTPDDGDNTEPIELTIDDLVETVKQKLKEELYNRSAIANALKTKHIDRQALEAKSVLSNIQALYDGRRNDFKARTANTETLKTVNKHVDGNNEYNAPLKDKMPDEKPAENAISSLQHKISVQNQAQIIQMKRPYVSKNNVIKSVPKIKIYPRRSAIRREMHLRKILGLQPHEIGQKFRRISMETLSRIPQQDILRNQRIHLKQPIQISNNNLDPNESNADLYEIVDRRNINENSEITVIPPTDESIVSSENIRPIPNIFTYKQTNETPKLDQNEILSEDDEKAAEIEDENVKEPKSIEKNSKEEIGTTDANLTEENKVENTTTKTAQIVTKENKIFSPDRDAKSSTITEKYDLDQPIPQTNRETENFGNNVNIPSSSNGKVLLL